MSSSAVLATEVRSIESRKRPTHTSDRHRRRPAPIHNADQSWQSGRDSAGRFPIPRSNLQLFPTQIAKAAAVGRLNPQTMPSRSTKVSEKLVLLPETALEEDDTDHIAEQDESTPTGLQRPLRHDEPAKSYAEKLPKERRTAELPRVTAYCTAQAYRMNALASFVRRVHSARTKLYDECMYCAYHLPLLPGRDGGSVRSSPVLKSPGGRTVIDEEMERNEQRDYDEDAFEGDEFFPPQNGEDPLQRSPKQNRGRSEKHVEGGGERNHSPRIESPHRPNLWLSFAEMFVFSYGVVVMWNFDERQEKAILADLASAVSDNGLSLNVRPQTEQDFETEEFHFEYSSQRTRPRIFNDMITLRSGDHMIKLAMSHAVAQSTKLSYFEEEMANTMTEAQHVPKRLALTGTLGLGREEVVKILGRLFKSRVDVNLSSNVLDDPRFFWESEPTLQPLYTALKEYLEIRPRVLVLNERCRVFLELAEILTDSISVKKMSRITWIIIILIVISIGVTLSEVFIRFGILNAKSNVTTGATTRAQSCICLPRMF